MSKSGKSHGQKGVNMSEGMTNEQFKIILQLIIQILKDDNVNPETIKKIEDLIKK